ncbi:[NiFe]-hydrogenase assembly chaperone HybE [Rhodoblastus acidophilus]|uniref:[NiFe]-hydrogenase assembly chaperone HybE n=1 Tax=Candidatus Rhodoblastus alkanivorans TaxID=2954117 RepID=A0ABS9Z2Y9_9HYPH|nr:[NiFe]-hydrogenase assembly chaperone HybE [Candidatus Rhodoblastus alkanivorans]MCI4677451.1 [NiFe]-hydrogenase assembly chaperone HybE [Candidatus Rhodoblastus alkanivorans]MCI4681810.1 [NiFe]-hydrogenase assembly chaperone HybE [Candidatus Rhodoblastus alkanivorans]MDI4642860.1 [NiFe]-hydrogenase assembly chaperone HybE [Rhodoblastus acidophilus]
MDETARTALCARLAEGLEAHFRMVHAQSMKDLPICNDRLAVAGAGFRPCGDWAIGIVVTPWFMNIFAAPFAAPVAAPPGETQRLALPVGEVDFLVAEVEGFGRLLSCSLFSPMDPFVDQEAALATARAALDALLTPPAPPPEQLAARFDRRALFRGAFTEREAAT